MKTLGELVERNARFFADDTCLVYGEHRFTYREHVGRARQLASALYNAGCRRQDRVAILAMNTFEYLEVFYNRVRRHSSLGFVSPAEFERAHRQTHR